MTIFKQLLITGTLILGMHHASYTYNACTLNSEIAQIFNFTQTLREIDNKQAFIIAQWLEQQMCDTSWNMNDWDVVTIVNVINNPDLTMQSKISALSRIIAVQKAEEKRITKQTMLNNIGTAIVIAAFLGCFTTLVALSIMEEIKNPTPKMRIYVEHKYC